MQIQCGTEPLVYPHFLLNRSAMLPGKERAVCVVKLTIVSLGVQATLLGHFSPGALGARVEAFPCD